MSGRPRHPSKEIEAAVAQLERSGWTFRKAGKSAHAWGRMLCPRHDPTGCQISVWSTPRVPEHHAAALIRQARNCAHGRKEDDEDI